MIMKFIYSLNIKINYLVWNKILWQAKNEMEAIQQKMVIAKKNERANALKKVKRPCKEFGFTAGMLKGSLAKDRGKD